MNELHIEILGQGTPLVMLHGWGWDSGIWQPILQLLENNHQLYLVDLPGFGKSPLVTKEYYFEEWVPQLLQQVPPQAAWLGWSLGGLVALWTAIHYPQNVTHLITITSSPRFVRDQDWPGIEPATLDKFIQLVTLDYQSTLRDFLELQLRGSPNRKTLLSTLQQSIVTAQQASPLALHKSLKLLREIDLRADLANIHCPSLHIFGSLDTIVPAKIAEIITPLLPNGQCKIIPRTGHMPFLTHPDIFIDTLNQFLG